MNKKDFWTFIENLFDKALDEELGTTGSGLGYVDKITYEGVEIDYSKYGLDFTSLMLLLEEFDNDGLIELIDTNNMCYLIHKK